MKKLWFISILLVLLPLTQATGECIYNLLEQGWGFNDGEEVGNHWGVVGLLEPYQPENPPIVFDFDTYEISFAILGMEIEDVFGTDVQVFELGGGTIEIYEDTSFDYDPGDSPATGIATSTNGTLALGGTIDHATLIINNLMEIGTILAEFTWDDGSYLAEVEALGEGFGLLWAFNFGLSFSPEVPVPPGYHSLWAGQIFSDCPPTDTMENSWSNLKSLY